MRRLFWLAAMLAATAFAAPAALAAPPPTLTGETFLACSSGLTIPDGGGGCAVGETKGTFTTARNCPPTPGPDPAPGSFTFAASGIAAGPYPGTVTANGSVTLGDFDATMGLQPILTFTESFTVDSAAGHVEGTKTLSVSHGGLCYTTPPFFGAIAFVETTYKATITTPDGKFRDEGTTSTTVFDANAGTAANPTEFAGFGESFVSSLSGTIPALPTTKDECKDGGWQTFGVFKNQGDCVSFVANGGKKPPTP
jgi:hypothetical protein